MGNKQLTTATLMPPTPFFFSEENSSIQGVGVEKLLEVGKLDKLKNGPLFWVDSADTHPCMGQCPSVGVGVGV